MKFMTSVLLIIINGCVFIPHNPSAEQPKLPNLYDQDYGTLEYVDNYNQQRSVLNKFWAQEAIGTPEARELIKEMQRNNFPLSSPQLAIMDSGFDLHKDGHPRFSEGYNQYIQSNYENEVIPWMEQSKSREKNTAEYIEKKKLFANAGSGGLEHGTKTLGIIAGKEPVGVSSLGEIDGLYQNINFEFQASRIDNGGKIHDVINASQGYSWLKHDALPGGGVRTVPATPVDPKMLSNARKFIEKTIFVNAAGNDFPQPIDNFIDELGDKMIVVGSADPSGFPSKFSQVSEHVAVLAPSDDFLQSIDADGKIVKFRGTSGFVA